MRAGLRLDSLPVAWRVGEVGDGRGDEAGDRDGSLADRPLRARAQGSGGPAIGPSPCPLADATVAMAAPPSRWWRAACVAGNSASPGGGGARGGWPLDWSRDHRRRRSCARDLTREAGSDGSDQVDPFRDPLERLLSMAATGTRARSPCPWTCTAPRMAATTSRPPARRGPQDRGDRRAQHLDDPGRTTRTTARAIRSLSPSGRGGRSTGAVAGRGRGLGEPHRWLRRRCPHVTIPASPKTQARRVQITHASGGKRTIPGSTAEKGEAPPAAPAAAEHPPGQACASRHGIRASAGRGRQDGELAATRCCPGGHAVAGWPYQAEPPPGGCRRTGTSTPPCPASSLTSAPTRR